MTWRRFLLHFEQSKQTSSVLTSLLKQTRLSEKRDGVFIINCKNYGTKIFLEKKKPRLEASAKAFYKKEGLSFVFVVDGMKKKKERRPLPLIDYREQQEEKVKTSGASPQFTFDNFAVSPTNHVAHAAALTISEKPGETYNPLFIYGGVGVGKTHLSHAIVNKIIQNNIRKNVLVCTSEEFTNDLIELIRKKNTRSLRKKYRSIDVLVVDDVQFIAGKTYVQEEFYHTFNSLVRRGAQIILTSDRPPLEIERLETRLRSRFSGGLSIDIQNPDFELRCAILLIKAQERNIQMDINAIKSIAQKITDTRELEGVLLKLYLQGVEKNTSITSSLVTKELDGRASAKREKITPNDVIRTVSLYYNLRPLHLRGKERTEKVARARQIVMYILRESFGYKLSEIAFHLKRKDHTTVLHGVKKISSLLIKSRLFREEVDSIVSSLHP